MLFTSRKGYYDYEDILNIEKENVVYQTNGHIRNNFGWEIVSRCFFSYDASLTKPEIVQINLRKEDRLFFVFRWYLQVYRSTNPKKSNYGQ